MAHCEPTKNVTKPELDKQEDYWGMVDKNDKYIKQRAEFVAFW